MKLNCYGCGGTGHRTVMDRVSCRSCNGRGYVEQWQQPGNPNETPWAAPGHVTCSHCYGHRVVDEQRYGPCSICSGTGTTGFDEPDDEDAPPSRYGRSPPHGRHPSPRSGEPRTPVIIIDTSHSDLGCAALLILLGVAAALWWGNGWMRQNAMFPDWSPRARLYLDAAAWWTACSIPMAIFSSRLQRVSGGASTVGKAVVWAVVAFLAASAAQVGAGWLRGGQVSVVVALVAAVASAVAAMAMVSPTISKGFWRLWLIGLLCLVAQGGLNTLMKPAALQQCLVVGDARQWLALQPLASPPAPAGMTGAACSGVRLNMDDARQRRSSDAVKPGNRKPGVAGSESVLHSLLWLSTDGFGFERSMGAWWANVALAYATCALLLATVVRLAGAVANRRRRSAPARSVDVGTSAWIALSTTVPAAALLLAAAAGAGSAQTPPVSVTTATLRPLVVLFTGAPILAAWTTLGSSFGVVYPEAVLDSLYQRMRPQPAQAPMGKTAKSTAQISEKNAAGTGVSGLWVGRYQCAQGAQAVRMRLQSLAQGRVEGIFEFFPVPGTSGNSGSFRLAGRYNSGRLMLKGGEWIEQPAGWRPVDLSVTLDAGPPPALRGLVTTPGCGAFSAELQP